MKLMVFLIILSGFQGFSLKEKKITEICLSKGEKELYNLIMDYRKEKRLPLIPLSVKLTLVAQTHTRDLTDNYNVNYSSICNPHSWSSRGKWSYCCYTNDHRHTKCMLEKPKEIAGYNGRGYEIAYYQLTGATALQSFVSWKKSSQHNPIMINEGLWANLKWKAIGIGIHQSYSTVWFGEDSDNAVMICH